MDSSKMPLLEEAMRSKLNARYKDLFFQLWDLTDGCCGLKAKIVVVTP